MIFTPFRLALRHAAMPLRHAAAAFSLMSFAALLPRLIFR